MQHFHSLYLLAPRGPHSHSNNDIGDKQAQAEQYKPDKSPQQGYFSLIRNAVAT
ncbi:hypothetical protein MICA_1080 [Micavibrio aeruginosavorus ARL-13]|uniref:Uncharacterized protein n=1 Tax=Micavibrio aeruginosavorus (strain ARL-13) TaxID=856793 RepID=G2KN75_MICAA|nr:hypothetical protein MICA_1080 [Micavibrio aeruginosavorus ARL-13]